MNNEASNRQGRKTNHAYNARAGECRVSNETYGEDVELSQLRDSLFRILNPDGDLNSVRARPRYTTWNTASGLAWNTASGRDKKCAGRPVRQIGIAGRPRRLLFLF